MRSLPKSLLIVMMASIVSMILTTGVIPNAYCETGDSAESSAPVYHRTYAGFEFLPSHSTLTYAPYSDGIYATTIPVTGHYFKKALDLPNGAEIRRIDLYVIDNSSLYNMTAQLVKFTPASGSQDVIASLYTAALPVSLTIQSVSITSNPLVTTDNSAGQYYLRYQPVTSGDEHVLMGVHIEYTLTTRYLPSVVIQ